MIAPMKIPVRLPRTAAVLLFAICTTIVAGEVRAETLPLDSRASSLSFTADAFLHKVQGEAREIAGSAELDPKAVPPVRRATVRFKLAALTTFNKARDLNMWSWLNTKVHPNATFVLDSVTHVGGESADWASVAHPATFAVSGVLNLNGVTQRIEAKALGWRLHDHLVVMGQTVLDTKSFRLGRLSMGFMKVGSEVEVAYRLSFVLPRTYVFTKNP